MKLSTKLLFFIGRISIICLLFCMMFSCKSKRITTETAEESISLRRIISEHIKAEPDFETLASRMQITYDDGKSKQRINANVRMKKDEIIWIKASVLGITVAKAFLTPDSVSLYETISKRYFEGDYSLISDWLGMDLNFKQAQALFLGQATIELKPNLIKHHISENKYILEAKQNSNIFRQNIAIYSSHFKIANQTIEELNQKRIFTLDYSNYQKINDDFYPSEMHLQSIDDKGIMRLHFQFRKTDVNPNISFPYEIPTAYKPMQLD